MDPSVEERSKPTEKPESKRTLILAKARDGQEKTEENVIFTKRYPIAQLVSSSVGEGFSKENFKGETATKMFQ